MRYPYFIARRDQCHEDSWTYGDWRQYVCDRPGGQTRCAFISIIPFVILVLAFAFGGFGVLSMIYLPPDQIAWGRAIPFAAICGVVFVGLSIAGVMGYRLMKAVGPFNDGSHRVLPGEEGKGDRHGASA